MKIPTVCMMRHASCESACMRWLSQSLVKLSAAWSILPMTKNSATNSDGVSCMFSRILWEIFGSNEPESCELVESHGISAIRATTSPCVRADVKSHGQNVFRVD
jgi:hypothetical protein